MTQQAILEKAMQKAYKNGWRPLHKADFNNCTVHQWQDNKMVGIAVLFPNRDMATSWVRELEGIIFNHDFARALWGTERAMRTIKTSGWLEYKTALWQYHLQQMVIADDPIKYLGANI